MGRGVTSAPDLLFCFQIPELRTGLLKNDWKAMSRAFVERTRSVGIEEEREEMRALAEMYDQIDLEQFMEDPK